MLFDIIFYSCLLFSTIGSYALIKHTHPSKFILKSLKGLFIFWTATLWIWQVLLLVVPKGSKLEEGIHLPRHLWVLDNVDIVPEIKNEKQIYGADPKHYYMYYPAPDDSKNKNTVVFYIHGGGWCLGGPHQHRFLAKLFQEQGYSLILPAYRFTPEHNYHDIQEDINSALVHSLEFLKEKGIHNPKFVLGGTSAGANLATLLGFDEQRWKQMGLDRDSLLRGVFSIAGALDIEKMEQTSTLWAYSGPQEEPTYQLANPISRISPEDKFPFLCLQGEKDGLTDYSNAVSFCNKIKSVVPKSNLNFMSIKNASHIDLGAGWYYNPNSNFGQDSILKTWINDLPQS